MHIYVNTITIIESDNGSSPGRRQAIIWTSAAILLIEHLGTNFNEIVIEILIFSFKKMHLKRSSAKWWPFRHILNVSNMLLLMPKCHVRNCWSLYPPYPKDRGMLWFYVEAARRPPPAACNGVNAITQKPLDGLFSNLVYTLVVIVSWPD